MIQFFHLLVYRLAKILHVLHKINGTVRQALCDFAVRQDADKLQYSLVLPYHSILLDMQYSGSTANQTLPVSLFLRGTINGVVFNTIRVFLSVNVVFFALPIYRR